MAPWHRGAVTPCSCGAGLLRLVRLHDLEVGFGCLHLQRSCGNVPAHSVFKGMNIVVVPLLFNYVDRSWAMGVENFLFSANANLNTNVNPLAAPYAICSYLFRFLLQFLVLAFGIDVIYLSVLDVICSCIILVCMIRLFL
jgi:hypothetical protein